MEDIKTLHNELFMDKWRRIIATYHPTHFFVVVCQGGKPSGWSEEAGTIWFGRSPDEFVECFRLFVQEGVDIAAVFSGYLNQLIQRGSLWYSTWNTEAGLRRAMILELENLALSS